eukprot:jgi/Orpsp1_1/1192931/evm.model.d7180000096991.1
MYMGLYIFTDIFKESWIEYVYGEKDTHSLYKCENCYLDFNSRSGFDNENKDIIDKTDLYKFLAALNKATSASDVESIFDLDQFYKEIAIEFLLNSWDHLRNGHNYYLYKNPNNNKWIYLTHDFDFDFGMRLGNINSMEKNIIEYNMKDMNFPVIVEKLILNDDRQFNETVKDIVVNVFNPATLFPRIDELKSYIEPYVKIDKTLNADGEYPGVLNKVAFSIFFSYEQWKDSIEYETIADQYYGLKQYILLRYRFICKEYGIECDPNYLDDTVELPTSSTTTEISTEVESTPIMTTSTVETTSIISATFTSSSTPTPTSEPSEPTPLEEEKKCLSELNGYPCCPPKFTTIYATDEYGDWSFDFSKNEWCGLTKYKSSLSNDNECWSEKLGYPCCHGCKVYETDSNGSWGYELNQWCGIIPSKC